MKIKFITDTETLIELDITDENADKQLEQFEVFNDREVLSYNIEFTDVVKLSQTHNFGNIKPEMVKQMTIKLK